MVFAAQILVLSIWVPYQLHAAFAKLRQQYPPSTYPRLYPVAPDAVERFNAILLVVRLAIVLAGTTLFAVELFAGQGPLTLARTMLGVLLGQSVPALLRLPWQWAVARAFRAMPLPAVRSAELRPSRLTEFVSLPLIAAGIAAATVSMVGAITLYISDPHSHDIALYVLAFSGWLMLRMLLVLRGPGSIPRPDPYMTDADVFRARRQRLRMLFTSATAVGVAFTALMLFKAGRLPVDPIAICVGTSIICQLVYLGTARTALRRIAARDASVYRTEPI